MNTLSATPIAAEYLANTGQECLLGKDVVTVLAYTKESRSGSYARGFKFGSNTYGIITKRLRGTEYFKPVRYSPDHGATWYSSLHEAKMQRAGKVKLASRSSKEFAFDSIQKINKDYDRNYAWTP